MVSILKSTVLTTVIVISGITASSVLSFGLESDRPALPAEYSDKDLNILGSRIKGFAFGTEGLIADWYYMRALQYIGDKMLNSPDRDVNLDDLRSLNPRLLYPLLNNATDLDPNFLGAYYYGAVVLPAIDGEEAIRLTEKGIDHNPGSWRLYQHLGYIYWKLGQYEKAAEAYETGSHVQGAAPFMHLMAGAMRSEGGSRETARQIFQQLSAGTDDPSVRSTAQRRLTQLNSLDQREAISKVLEDFRTQTGRCPVGLNEIKPLLKSIQLPGNQQFHVDSLGRLCDPYGTPYEMNREDCRLVP